MLILSRKTGQSFSIGKHITVKVLEIEGDRVGLGIEAPKEMKILRTELYEEIINENKQAVKVSNDALKKFRST